MSATLPARRASRLPALALTLSLALLGSCSALSPTEEQQYENLIAQGAEPIRVKDPSTAALLNVLPGFGDIYNRQWGVFVFDLVTWYPSILWAVPQSVVTAQNINKRATIAHYTVGPGRALGFDANTPVTVTPAPAARHEAALPPTPLGP